jgi:hypothetical protein
MTAGMEWVWFVALVFVVAVVGLVVGHKDE